MSYGNRGLHRRPFGGGWRKDRSFDTPRHQDDARSAGAGRRLMPAELAKVAAEMELPVSNRHYEAETTQDNRRAYAYQGGVAAEATARPAFAPRHLRKKRPVKPQR
jgi:hypothetical protein